MIVGCPFCLIDQAGSRGTANCEFGRGSSVYLAGVASSHQASQRDGIFDDDREQRKIPRPKTALSGGNTSADLLSSATLSSQPAALETPWSRESSQTGQFSVHPVNGEVPPVKGRPRKLHRLVKFSAQRFIRYPETAEPRSTSPFTGMGQVPPVVSVLYDGLYWCPCTSKGRPRKSLPHYANRGKTSSSGGELASARSCFSTVRTALGKLRIAGLLAQFDVARSFPQFPRPLLLQPTILTSERGTRFGIRKPPNHVPPPHLPDDPNFPASA